MLWDSLPSLCISWILTQTHALLELGWAILSLVLGALGT